MTRYSIPSETAGQNLFTLTTDDRLTEVESLDWESRMARLVGFQEESPPTTEPQTSEESATSESSVTEPQELQTKQPLSSNPFAKLGLVGSGTLAIVLIAGVFLSQLMSSGNKKPTNIVTPEVRSQVAASTPPDLAAEVETLKTKLALTEQVELVKSAQQQLRTDKRPSIVASQIEPIRDRPRIRPQITPAPITTAYVPRPLTTAYIPRPLTVERPMITPSLPPQLPIVKQETPAIVNVTPPAPPNPLDEWSRLAKLGSYGQVNVSDKPNVASAVTYTPPQNTQVAQQPPNPNQNQTPPQTSPMVSPGQSQNPKSVAVGTSAKAVLATAVFGETTKNSRSNDDKDDNKNVFVVRLKQPLKATDGTIALPANTELLTQIRSISEQGLLQLDVTKVITQNNGALTERSLPDNAIIIRAPEGRPLLANQFSAKGASILGMDIGLSALGAVGKVGEIFNRNDNQVVTVNGTTTITSGSSNRNVVAGLLEGATNTVVPQISQRNQQAISQMMQRSNVWFLAAGKDVEIYLNQPMQF